MITWFWEVVHAFSEEQKKRLLAFVTGSDRVPIRCASLSICHAAKSTPVTFGSGVIPYEYEREIRAHMYASRLTLPVVKLAQRGCDEGDRA